MFKLLEGPQTLGRGKIFWSCFLAVLAGALTYPLFADSYDVGNFAYFLIWIFMALGLCLMWGYGGMLSFGQTLFFGIAVTVMACSRLTWAAAPQRSPRLRCPLSLRWWRPASSAIS